MAKQANNFLSSYILTEQEEFEGTLLTLSNKLVLQNKVYEISEQILGLVPNPASYPEFIQQQAYLSGQRDILKYLLDASLASEEIAASK